MRVEFGVWPCGKNEGAMYLELAPTRPFSSEDLKNSQTCLIVSLDEDCQKQEIMDIFFERVGGMLD
jgi:hypothetical protein